MFNEEKIRIKSVPEQNRKDHLELLLLADEQEEMVDKYIFSSQMYIMEYENNVVACCVVAVDEPESAEIKNIAVSPAYQGRGLGRFFIEFVERTYLQTCSQLFVGTGDSPLTVPFYEKCGFKRHHVIENFFTDNYDHPIIECGMQLKDMVYFAKEIQSA